MLWVAPSWRRAEAIWAAWVDATTAPALFTSVVALVDTEGALRPWLPQRVGADDQPRWVWRDVLGRPRSLNPVDLQERVWRYEPMTVTAAVRARGLLSAMP